MPRKSREDNLELLRGIQISKPSGFYLGEGKTLFQLASLPIALRDLAAELKLAPSALITKAFTKGKPLNINQNLSVEEVRFICNLFNFKHQTFELNRSDFFSSINLLENQKGLKSRPPVVAFMGHVDHGKTTLLDYIRNTKVVKEEAGGITQRCAAYQVKANNGLITFIDTPGHEAFRLMRQRGAQLTDFIILVVAADEPLKPQTKEVVVHAKSCQVPLIVFLNKIDKPLANPQRIIDELASLELFPDSLGGNTTFIEGSGLTGKGVDDLLDAILLQASIDELNANPNRLGIGTVLDCSYERGKGAVATLIVRNGTLIPRDTLVFASESAKIRSLTTTQGSILKAAPPATPCLVSGFSTCPLPGTTFIGVKDERQAKEFIAKGLIPQDLKQVENGGDPGLKKLNLIIRSDNQGTAEAIRMSLAPLANSEAQVKLLKVAPGELNQGDVLLAKASQAKLVCFATKANKEAKLLAKTEAISIFYSLVIYDLIDRVKSWLKDLKTPVYEDRFTGEALILKIFYYSKVGNIAGCSVQEGYVIQNAIVEVWRNNKLIHKGKIDSLRKKLDSIKRVDKGFEFGTHIKDFNDIKIGDTLKFFEKVLVEDE